MITVYSEGARLEPEFYGSSFNSSIIVLVSLRSTTLCCQKIRCQGITKVTKIYCLQNTNICMRFHGNPSSNC